MTMKITFQCHVFVMVCIEFFKNRMCKAISYVSLHSYKFGLKSSVTFLMSNCTHHIFMYFRHAKKRHANTMLYIFESWIVLVLFVSIFNSFETAIEWLFQVSISKFSKLSMCEDSFSTSKKYWHSRPMLLM